MPIISRLAETCRLYAQKPAVVSNSGEITYGDLQDLINRFAAGILKLGVKPGDRVIVALENSPEFIVAFYALLQVGAVLVPVDPLYTVYEIGPLVRETSPALAICSAANMAAYLEVAGKWPFAGGIVVTGKSGATPAGVHLFGDLLKGPPAGSREASRQREGVAEIIYTPGNTGIPKGVMLTSQNLYSCAVAFAAFCQLTPQDRVLLLAPAHRSSVQCCVLLAPMFSGAAVVIQDRWPGSGQLLRLLEEEKITFFFGPPTYYALLLKEQAGGQARPSSLRVAYCTGGQLSPSLAQSFAQRFGLEITEGYCLTEATSVVCSNPWRGAKKPGSVGLPLPGTEVRIVDYEGRPLPPGQVGEIVVRGPGVMKGYLGQPEQTRWVLRNGWLHTEDLGYMDREGYVYILDRKKNIIIKGGHSIDPREVEDVLYQHPQVLDTVVVGVPDPVMGEEVMALVMLRENQQAEPGELQAFCAQRLAPYKVPGKIQLVSDLPKTTSGKLLRQGLKEGLGM
ncbi:class I adenylate-forming enzyme family protein [Desulfovirgula thermocuniculi]|uniref:class I adenylate-forming enzyme family protein n=1 Tax=Desulfovirgula thermocuniculi TaxID=348842 RepID=UPI0003FCFFBC|nr:AMP-binding protein [Desulfovirgula thermocuniculi]